MSAELVRAARAEEQRLLQELKATPLFRRWETVRALLAEYDANSAAVAHSLVAAPVSLGRPRVSAHRAGGMTAQVVTASAEYLRTEQRRAQSAEILEALQRRGVQITGSKPVAVVASILSHSDLFDNIRREGYGLTEWSQGQAAPGNHSDDPESGPDESGIGGDHANPPNETLDSRSDLMSDGSWATNVDRSRPNPDHNI